MVKPKSKTTKGPSPRSQKEPDANPDFRFLVRISNTDINGESPLYLGLTNIEGIGRRVSIKIVDDLGFDRKQRIGDMSDEEIEKIQAAVGNIHESLPNWMMNRQKDYNTGDDVHLVSSEVMVARRDDINRFKKIRSYKGIRHERGHKVRGQRLKSNGRTGLVLGVSKKRR